MLFFWSNAFSGFLVKADGKRERLIGKKKKKIIFNMFFLQQWNRTPLAGPEASPWGLLCASNSPSSFLHNSSFHPVISSPSSVLLLGSRSFVRFLHGRHQDRRSLRGKYKPLYDLPFCSGRGSTTARQLLCSLYLPKKYIKNRQAKLFIEKYISSSFRSPLDISFYQQPFHRASASPAWLDRDWEVTLCQGAQPPSAAMKWIRHRSRTRMSYTVWHLT